MAKITLITGGCRSGKSYYAVRKALEYNDNRVFFATAVPFDEEMKIRIKKHLKERGDTFTTVEAPYTLPEALYSYNYTHISVVLIDCITVWIGNCMHKYNESYNKVENDINRFIDTIQNIPVDTIIVTNEVGMGIVPEHKMGRMFRDFTGTVNRRVADCAHEVFLTVCGIAVKIKPEATS